jgi:hypothetical protein
MAATLNSLSATLRSPPGFSHLSRLYSLPLAYGRLLVESYRRLAFGTFFLEQSGKVAEVMARWVTGERRRREKYEAEMKGLLPWDARTTDEVPGLEVSTVGGGIGEDGLAVSKVDVDGRSLRSSAASPQRLTKRRPTRHPADFLTFIESLERDPGYIELAAASANLDKPGLLVDLRETLSKHLAQVEDAKADFDKLVEKNCAPPAFSRPARLLADTLRFFPTVLSKSQDGSGRRGCTSAFRRWRLVPADRPRL